MALVRPDYKMSQQSPELTQLGPARLANLDIGGLSRVSKQLLHVFDLDGRVLLVPLRLDFDGSRRLQR